MLKTVIFDIDDTSGDLKTILQDIYRKETGDTTITYDDWNEFDAENRYGISSDRLGQLFIEDKSLERMLPHEGISEVTHFLKDAGYNVEFVTARGWHPNATNITREWLNAHNIAYDRINIVPLFEDKETHTRHIENIHLFIDDRYEHCVRMMASGRVKSCLLYKQPWNLSYRERSLPGNKIYTIESVKDVLNYIGE